MEVKDAPFLGTNRSLLPSGYRMCPPSLWNATVLPLVTRSVTQWVGGTAHWRFANIRHTGGPQPDLLPSIPARMLGLIWSLHEAVHGWSGKRDLWWWLSVAFQSTHGIPQALDLALLKLPQWVWFRPRPLR